MTAPRILPEVVRRARVGRGLTQRELAQRMGVAQQTFHRLEEPGHLVTAHQIEAVAKALETTVAVLLEEYDRTRDAPELERGWHAGDPPPEAFAPPGAERDAQLARLMRATDGNASAVARCLGVTRQAVSQARAAELARAAEPVGDIPIDR